MFRNNDKNDAMSEQEARGLDALWSAILLDELEEELLIRSLESDIQE